MPLAHPASSTPGQPLLAALADFRFQLRSFLQCSEQAAHQAGLQPQQHQLLLQIAGAPPDTAVTIAYAAARLGLRHNSAVELVNRCAAEDLLLRAQDPSDSRKVLLRVTANGAALLHRLSSFHARELDDLAPKLLRSLRSIRRAHTPARRNSPAAR